jgi:hypothetical protein
MEIQKEHQDFYVLNIWEKIILELEYKEVISEKSGMSKIYIACLVNV